MPIMSIRQITFAYLILSLEILTSGKYKGYSMMKAIEPKIELSVNISAQTSDMAPPTVTATPTVPTTTFLAVYLRTMGLKSL